MFSVLNVEAVAYAAPPALTLGAPTN